VSRVLLGLQLRCAPTTHMNLPLTAFTEQRRMAVVRIIPTKGEESKIYLGTPTIERPAGLPNPRRSLHLNEVN
jgi:hypothetical protein